MNPSRLNRISRHFRSLAPYLLVELLLPGGTLLALVLWLSQNHRIETRHVVRVLSSHSRASVSLLRAMLPHTALPVAKR